MTNAEMRVALAKRFGWTLEDSGSGLCWHKDGILSEEAPPDYPNDLNAVHEACKETKMVWNAHAWNRHLFVAVFGKESQQDVDRLSDADLTYILNNATASQRTEACLRTLGDLK